MNFFWVKFNKFFYFVGLIFCIISSVEGKWVDESVWSDKLGEELWNFSQMVTKQGDVKSKYMSLNATLKDGKTLLNEIKENVERMIKKKVEAVQCIAKAAEELRRNVYFMEDFKLEYYSMKYSIAEDSDYIPILPWKLDENTEYKNMTLEPNSNFYNIPVNINYSAVHVPTNVYDRYRYLAETIMWSEDLNEVFLKNYHSDPSMSWQYFGSAFGLMRQYPAMQWNGGEDQVDLYDCRTRPWFIEAATCTKDVIILMDNSGSMTGMRNTIAKLVVNSLLKTFGNNDFINVLKFSWKAESVLNCFKDKLAQATPETIKSFHEAVSHVKPEGNASFPNALAYSLKLLEQYREGRKCGEFGGCNQAIMLVTDGLPGNVTEVFENMNVDDNGLPLVRIFTFLVGTEVKGVQDLQLMACRNRGYYVHIHDLDEVHDQVLKYISVIARPLVLQRNEHPVVWTHAFADVNDPKLTAWLWKVMKNSDQEKRLLQYLSIKPEYFSKMREDSKYVQKITQNQGEKKEIEHQEYRLMTSVSVPVYDKKENNETKVAELLGVAGTDVSIDHINLLSYPYKTGTNGYAFIVTNNGYLLMHPDLRPVFEGTLKLNHDSVDLAEVEFLDDDTSYKEYNADILKMRELMVNQTEAEFLNQNVKFHYDDFQRIGIEKRNYYFAPLSGTLFSLGVVIPSDFAYYQIAPIIKTDFYDSNSTKVELEIDKYLKREDSDEKDPEWRLHPDWVYCKYHFPNYKVFDSPEDELLHFLELIKAPGWEWKRQYANSELSKDECDFPEKEEDDYYCDKELLDLLVIDSQMLENFREPRVPKNSFETKLLDTYNPNLRFVATQSGLTKWQLIPKPLSGEETNSDFINAFPRGMNEPWYKMAVLQNQIDEDSYVFSMPFKSNLADEKYVIATHAIFHKKSHDGKKAPAAVLGYRFEQNSLHDRFMEITSETDKFTMPCHSDSRECYLLDHNGYIIVSSKDVNETGQFFGKFEPSVMSILVQLGIYEEKIIYDYQGLCIYETPISNNANFLLTPWIFIKKFFQYTIIDFFWNILQSLSYQTFNIEFVLSLPSVEDDEDSREFKDYDSDESIEEDFEIEKDDIPNATVRIQFTSKPCDKNKTLYLLQQKIFSEKHIYGVRQNSSRFRFANRIPHTNLILVVLNTLYSDFGDIQLSIESNTLPIEECPGSNVFNLPRKRRSNCFTQHPEEIEVEACGKGHLLKINNMVLGFLIVIQTIIKFSVS